MTRCRPKDIAFIKRSIMGNQGRLVDVVGVAPKVTYFGMAIYVLKGECWWTVRPIGKPLNTPHGPLMEWWVKDSNLQPIRDPGPEAVDEVLQRIPSPMKEKETA